MMNKNDYDDNGQPWIEVPSFVNRGSEVNIVSGKLKNTIEFEDEYISDDLVKEVNSSLAQQLYDFDIPDAATKKGNTRQMKKKKKKGPAKIFKILIFTLLSLGALGCLLFFTDPGNKLILKLASDYIYGNFDYTGEDSKTASGDNNPSGKNEVTDKIVNILLVGIEEIKNARNTDTMIIATMNTEDNTLKLTSLMRDLYVEIPGYDNNRLNAAYAKGGIELLYKTIEVNFDIKLNGYCMVNFEAFEKIVDLVGGVEITLTEKEAKYLNTTNYISKPQYRKVVVGKQTLNGNQALGYCRIRKRPTATERDDYGRTQRQRIVLSAIYSKAKSKNIVELVVLMNKILTTMDIDTDITKKEFNRYLEAAIDLKVKELDTFRIPTDNNVENVIVGKKDVIRPKDWDLMVKDLHDFIYGNTEETSK